MCTDEHKSQFSVRMVFECDQQAHEVVLPSRRMRWYVFVCVEMKNKRYKLSDCALPGTFDTSVN